ncbi:NUDIX domain-containing protein [Oleiagrimonas sp. C23AA]|uniref:NUDIX domain-containing protein n=1 Tax=Oleiagrimonas sp. C23AA TaxID=2719047 RepID=UPI001423AD2A|nr:NUDIX domain-containing protein [Oleiagrimonas sp. C23AA]NII11431.1 NUDIX domain-containing protein [Oleiagrimonas sp. C23AA]
MHVVAGVLEDAAGQILLARRLPGKHLAGLWEFPGGKVESGEEAPAALARELGEELDLTVDLKTAPTLLIELPWRYADNHLRLAAWHVPAWQGQAQGMEGQDIAWVDPRQVNIDTLAPADRAILRALRLPRHLQASDVRRLNSPVDIRRGEHWPLLEASMLIQCTTRLWPVDQVFGVICRSRDELDIALRVDADFAIWASEAETAAVRRACLPIYALAAAGTSLESGWQGTCEPAALD